MRAERRSAGSLCPKHAGAIGRMAEPEEENVRLKARVAPEDADERREAPAPSVCPDCGAPLVRVAPEGREVRDIPPPRLRTVHWARGPDIPAENNRAERGVGGLVMARKTSFGGQSEGALRVRQVNRSAVEALALRHADPAGKPAGALDIYAATGKKSDVREFLFPKRRVGRLNCAERQAQR